MPQQIQNRLWTPVSNALEAYRRRLLADSRAVYEHIWRLIHIEESLVVTLGSALAARLMERWIGQPHKCEDLSVLRFLVTGLRNGGEDGQSGDSLEGACWQGFIGAWTDVLNRFGVKAASEDCPFCKAVAAYLSSELQESLAFLDPWSRIGPVPETFKATRSRIGRIKAINSLRNKLAHVPISENILKYLHSGIRREVLMLLTRSEQIIGLNPKADPRITKSRDVHEVLLGRLSNGESFVTGTEFGHDAEIGQQGIWFDWSSEETATGQLSCRWNAAPFLLLDDELKVLLLFRLPGLEPDPDDDSLTGEYHRFAAEIEPVQEMPVPVDLIRAWLPEVETLPTQVPAETETAAVPSTAAVEPVSPAAMPPPATAGEQRQVVPPLNLTGLSPNELRSRAEQAYRNRDYPLADTFLDELSTRGSPAIYNHVTKLRHGEVKWKSAERMSEGDDQKPNEIRRAVQLLEDAAHHRDVRYAARARYQLSKALLHLWRYEKVEVQLKRALAEAEQAARLAFEPSYISWYEKVLQEAEPWLTAEPAPVVGTT